LYTKNWEELQSQKATWKGYFLCAALLQPSMKKLEEKSGLTMQEVS
jgi:hypothetical protein